MSAKKSIVLFLVVLAALVIGAVGALYLIPGLSFANEETYYAVQVENGDIYFGKVVRFPKFGLRDVYIPQSFGDPNNPLGSSLRVIPLNQAAIWGATEINLNRDKIIFISKVDPQSQVMQAIKNK